MSNGLLYNVFGVRGQIYRKTECVDGEVHFYAGLKPRHFW